jgi:hypothetical protein
VFMAIDALDFPELHDESIPYMAFLKNCTRLLAAAGVRDFNMQVHQSCKYPKRSSEQCCRHSHISTCRVGVPLYPSKCAGPVLLALSATLMRTLSRTEAHLQAPISARLFLKQRTPAVPYEHAGVPGRMWPSRTAHGCGAT